MRCQLWIGILVVVLAAGGRGLLADPPSGEPPQDGFFKRLGPAGGWHPYAGGLLHWWRRDCFPRGGRPDDYCRKPLPRVCWPPYPPYYSWGPQQNCSPPSGCRPASKEAH
jgi:hypothetical protein